MWEEVESKTQDANVTRFQARYTHVRRIKRCDVASPPGPARLVALALLGVAGGCLDSEPRPARWGYLHTAIILPACTTAACHSGMTAIAGVNLTGREGAYTILTGRICGEPIKPQDPPRNYVTPFSAEYSTLIHQLRGEDRAVMPPDSRLPETEIELVERWIDAGAPCD